MIEQTAEEKREEVLKHTGKSDAWLELEAEIVEYYGGDKELAYTANPLPHALSKIARLQSELDTMKEVVFFTKVYALLMTVGAPYDMLDAFVHSHVHNEQDNDGWRFCGIFGMSGKYWREQNQISGDDHEEEMERVNKFLAALSQKGT
jgi:hypothetical protein